MSQDKVVRAVKVILIVAVLTIGTSYVLAANWTSPRQSPPHCDEVVNGVPQPGCSIPLNVSSNSQVKTGGLGVGGFFSTVGKAVIGSASPNIVDALKLKVDGKVGAEAYCDRDGNNCAMPPFGGGGAGFWQVDPSDPSAIKNTNSGKVNIAGKIRISGGQPFKDKVLVAQDETGLARWRHVSELLGDTTFVANCPAGKAIQAIEADGTPVCIDVNSGNTTAGNSFLFSLIPGGLLSGILNPGEGDSGCTTTFSNDGGRNAPACNTRNTDWGVCIDQGSSGTCSRRLCC